MSKKCHSSSSQNASSNVEQGETFVLLSPNGEAKSTIVEILEGSRKRRAGGVKVLGVDPEKGSQEFRSRIGIVEQIPGDSGELSIKDIYSHFAGLYPKPGSIDELFAAARLDASANNPVKKHSDGFAKINLAQHHLRGVSDIPPQKTFTSK